MVKILVIDPERSVRNTLKEMLEYEGFRVDTVQDYTEGVIMAETIPFNVVVCDAACHAKRGAGEINSNIPIVITSRDPTVDAAVAALSAGAVDYISKPIDMNRLLGVIRKVTADDAPVPAPVPVEIKLETQPRPRRRGSRVDEIVGESPKIKHVKHLIDKVAPTEARLLIMGGNGTGKELVARWLHEKSNRNGGPFVEVNCAAIPSELIESELFGHEKGAFTSAIKQRKGKFEQADGGTLFMDEIGDMSLAAQAKVLRVLQENRLSRVGSDHDVDVNVRVVAATNKNLQDEIEKGNFREDLYHRLSVIIIIVPSLRERLEDIPLLVDSFLKKICTEYGIPVKKIEPQAIEQLKTLSWRGNIRELRNVVERLVILSGEKIVLEDVVLYAEGAVV